MPKLPGDDSMALERAAIVGGERANANERVLHQALRRGANRLESAKLASNAGEIFSSFFIGGFECSTHVRRDGVRLDLLGATQHDRFAESDFRTLAEHGIKTVRDGIRWHLIERSPGQYDWSSFLPLLRAAQQTDTQVIWDICHWGWPDHIEIWSNAFIERFAAFAKAVATLVKEETDSLPFFVPINEISFWSWAGGCLGCMNPGATGRGNELKSILVRAAIAAIEALKSVDPRCRIVSAEPAINVIPRSASKADIDAARRYTHAQFEALDFISGIQRPGLGGKADYIDIVGVNYYLHNQWVDEDLPVSIEHPAYRPLSLLLLDVYRRYGRPIFVAETGIEGDWRPDWLRIVGAEVRTAQDMGVPIAGVCLYPITDYPGWDDDRPCRTGLMGSVDRDGSRVVFAPLAQELAAQQMKPAIGGEERTHLRRRISASGSWTENS
jgi:hypothetical protein